MTQYTDVIITFTVHGVDMNTISNPHVTFDQKFGASVDITDINIISSEAFSVTLTQAQTAVFSVGDISVQMNFFNSQGRRRSTDIQTIPVGSNLLRRILGDD